MNKKKKLLIVNPGSELKEFFFRELTMLGVNYFVILTEDHPKFIHTYCPKNKYIHVHTYQAYDIVNSIINFSNKNKVTFDGILTFNESDVYETAIVAEYFNLPTISSSAALHSSSNKFLMRESCKRAHISMPKYKLFCGLREGLRTLKEFSSPVVIKPINKASSEGVMKIENPLDKKSFEHVYRQICNTIDVPIKNNTYFLMEEYISGIVTSIDGLVQNNKVHIISISDFLMEHEPNFFQTSCFIPSNLNSHIQNVCRKETEKIIRALGFNNCSFHCELRIHNNKPYFLEIAARCGGGYVALQIKEAYNINYIELLVNVAFGEKVSYTIKKTNNVTSNYRLTCEQRGILKNIHGFNTLGNLHGVKEYVQFLHVNDYVPSKNTFAIAGFFLSAPSRQDICALIQVINSKIVYSCRSEITLFFIGKKIMSRILRKISTKIEALPF